jgi:glycosyltransferase involved in cell wall biosynthesis
VSKLTKLFKYSITLFKNVYKKHNTEAFNDGSKKSLKETKVTIPNTANLNKIIFVDPIGRIDSGISSYVKNARLALKDMGVDSQIITKTEQESIIEFRKRVALHVQNIKKDGNYNDIIVEAPETCASTINILPNQAKIHIRLHCSKNISNFISGQPLNKEYAAEEQTAVDNADYISAPSISASLLSKNILNLPKSVNCYPNPIYENVDLNIKKDNTSKTILFVGRLHELKGIKWLIYLAKKLPDISFCVICPMDDRHKYLFLPSNITLVDGKSWDKNIYYRRARAVIIPSIYETTSMVGVEAIAMGTPVITWAHLGISEYAEFPFVTSIKPWDIDTFVNEIKNLLKTDINNLESHNFIQNINVLFFEGFKKTISKEHIECMPSKPNAEILKDIKKILLKSAVLQENLMDIMPRWKRKMYKLKNKPLQFFKDSILFKNILPSGSLCKEKLLQINKEVALEHNNLFTNIQSDGRIEFLEPPSKPEGVITLFLYANSDEDIAKSIIGGLNTFDEDFKYVCTPMLQVGLFSEQSSDNVVKFIERIDLKNKQKISSIDHIVFLNPPPVIVQGLRCCGTRQRTIVIITDSKYELPNEVFTDVLIVLKVANTQDCSKKIWRRKIVTEDISHLHFSIRRAIQEGASKKLDYLLPLMGFNDFCRQELLNINVKFYQGIIKLSKKFMPIGATNSDIYNEMSKYIGELAVTESVYLKYKSICDNIDKPEIKMKFLSYAIFDGVIFDVRS